MIVAAIPMSKHERVCACVQEGSSVRSIRLREDRRYCLASQSELQVIDLEAGTAFCASVRCALL